jgi:hypothetical protein
MTILYIIERSEYLIGFFTTKEIINPVSVIIKTCGRPAARQNRNAAGSIIPAETRINNLFFTSFVSVP